MWACEYWYGDKHFDLKEVIYPGNVGDWVYLWEKEFRILSVRYYPEQGIVRVSLTTNYFV